MNAALWTAQAMLAVGLLVPWGTGIATVMTPLAAGGLCVVMIGAAWAHSRLHEPGNVAVCRWPARSSELTARALPNGWFEAFLVINLPMRQV